MEISNMPSAFSKWPLSEQEITTKNASISTLLRFFLETSCILQANKHTVGTELYLLLLKISPTIQLTVSLKRSNMLSSVCVQEEKQVPGNLSHG